MSEESDIKVSSEMDEAWCRYEPIGQFKETMSFARFNGMMRHAFLSGYRSAEKVLDSREKDTSQ